MRWSLFSHPSSRTQWLLRVRIPAQVHLATVLLAFCTRPRSYTATAPSSSATSVPVMPTRPSPPAPGPSRPPESGPKDVSKMLKDQLQVTSTEESLLYRLARVYHVRRRHPDWPSAARIQELTQPTPQELDFLRHTEYVCQFAERLATTSRPEYAEIVMRTAFAFGTTSKKSRLERVAYQLYTAEQWRALLSLVAFAQELHTKLSSRLMDWRVLALVKCNVVLSLHGVLDEYAQHGLTPSRRSYHLLLRSCLRNHDLALSRECLEEMKKAGFAVDASTVAVIITNYGALGLEHNIEDHALKALETATNHEIVVILNGLIKLYLDNGDLPGALNYLKILEDPATFTSHDQDRSGPESGDPLRKHVLQNADQLPQAPAFGPDLSTYIFLMHYASQSKDISWTTRILGRLKNAGLVPDARVATILIKAFYAHKAPVEALRVMLDLCRGAGRSQLLALFGFRFLKPAHTYHGPFQGKPTIAVCNALFEGVLDVRGIVTFPAIIRLMRTHSVEPNEVTMSILLNYLRREGISRKEALRVVKRVQARTSLKPSLRILHNHLDNELRIRKYGMLPMGGKYLIRKVETSDDHERTLSAPRGRLGPAWAVTKLLPRRKRESLRSLIRELEKEGVNSTRYTFSLNLRREAVLKGDIDAAQAQFDAMIQRGLRPNSHHYSALMEGLTLRGDVQEALTLLKSANDNGIPSNVVLYTILITGYARLRRPDMALHIFQQMIDEGVKPDAKSVYALAEAYRIAGQWWMARAQLRKLWHMIEPEPSIDIQQASLGALRLRLLSLISPEPSIPLPTGMTKVDRKHYVRHKFSKGLQYWARLFPRRLNFYS